MLYSNDAGKNTVIIITGELIPGNYEVEDPFWILLFKYTVGHLKKLKFRKCLIDHEYVSLVVSM